MVIPLTTELWTVREVAQLLHVHEWTVRKWIRCGVVTIVRVGPAERIRIPSAEVARLSGHEAASERL